MLPDIRIYNRLTFLIILIIITVFSVYNYYTPLYVDDYTYSFFYSPVNIRDNFPRIPIISAYTDNFAGVARFIPHLIIGFFQHFGKIYFDIVSGLIFILFGLLTAKTVATKRQFILPLALISCSLLFFIVNGFFTVAIWMSGAPNYIFVAILVCSYIILLKNNYQISDNRRLNYIFCFIWGFIVGWTNEGFILGLTVASWIYYFQNHKHDGGNRLTLIVGLTLGCLCLCLSPFNLFRFFGAHNETSLSEIVKNLISACLNLDNLRILPLFIIMITAYYFTRRYLNKPVRDRIHIKQFFKEEYFLSLALIISLFFIIFTRFSSAYSRFPVEFYALLLILRLLVRNTKGIDTLRYISIFGGMGIIVALFLILPNAKRNYEAYEHIKNQVQNNQKIVISERIKLNTIEQRYIVPPHKFLYPHTILKYYSVDKYYSGLNFPVIIDEEIYSNIINLDLGQGMWRNDWGASYFRIPQSCDINKVILKLKPVDFQNLKIPEKWIAPYSDAYRLNEVRNDRFDIINIEDMRFLIIPDNGAIMHRLNNIEVSLNCDGNTIILSDRKIIKN